MQKKIRFNLVKYLYAPVLNYKKYVNRKKEQSINKMIFFILLYTIFPSQSIIIEHS